MDALSSEWKRDSQYLPGDRVAFKIGDSVGIAAFECLKTHVSDNSNQVNPQKLSTQYCMLKVSQPVQGGNEFWKHYPRGFPRVR
ncbi:hypothetical protein BDQ12DRAFT_681392 [Crucibulum laeve]|uniref:Uncharacterized protein n=1 Tax=Crucibulum laeve TaxID=68775 RepID=A0A5C3M675_9AGAR|nr:hypothetical protein BDQ12DRAFT_681392 [Crucibulum laeve]